MGGRGGRRAPAAGGDHPGDAHGSSSGCWPGWGCARCAATTVIGGHPCHGPWRVAILATIRGESPLATIHGEAPLATIHGDHPWRPCGGRPGRYASAWSRALGAGRRAQGAGRRAQGADVTFAFVFNQGGGAGVRWREGARLIRGPRTAACRPEASASGRTPTSGRPKRALIKALNFTLPLYLKAL